jgi:hypothetical protein
MKTSNESIRKVVEADKAGKALVVCPQCGDAQKIDVIPHKAIDKVCKLKVSCGKCGSDLDVMVNFRNCYRKNTRLSGLYKLDGSTKDDYRGSGEAQEAVIENISKYGLGFKMMTPDTLKVGDILHMKFVLDNSKRTVVSKKVIVKRVKENFVGVQFVKSVDSSEPDLAFYLW